MKHKPDGSVIASGMPVQKRKNHKTLFGLQKGLIKRVVYPNDSDNTTGERVEYVLKVRGQSYPNAVDVRKSGGIYNYEEQIRKPVQKAFGKPVSTSTYDSNTDGEIVYVLFLEGNGDIPIIIGGANHPKHPAYKKGKRADGLYKIEEYNGIEFKVDQNGNYTISQTGLKDPNGAITNPTAVGSVITVSGTENKIEIAAASHVITLKNGELDITVTGNANINVSGNAVVNATEIDLNGSAGKVLTTNTDPLVDLIYGTSHQGVPSVKAGS